MAAGYPRMVGGYDRAMPRIWTAAMVILVICLIASIVIGATKL